MVSARSHGGCLVLVALGVIVVVGSLLSAANFQDSTTWLHRGIDKYGRNMGMGMGLGRVKMRAARVLDEAGMIGMRFIMKNRGRVSTRYGDGYADLDRLGRLAVDRESVEYLLSSDSSIGGNSSSSSSVSFASNVGTSPVSRAMVSERRHLFLYPYPRGLHWENRWASSKAASHADDSRLAHWPFSSPLNEDPGTEYLPFNAHLVRPEFNNKPRLIYDLLLVRSSDAFGLIDDGYSLKEMLDIMQGVVDVFAAGNVHVRVAVNEVKYIRKISQQRSVAYVGYVEGPDAEELDFRQGDSLPRNWVNTKKAIAAKERWLKHVTNESFGVNFIDQLRGQRRAVGDDAFRVHSMIEQDYLDWVLGFPMLLTPWDLVFSTAVFPVRYFHNLNGIGGSGRIVLRAGACGWNDNVQTTNIAMGTGHVLTMITDNLYNVSFPATCRRFLMSPDRRLRVLKNGPYRRDHERQLIVGRVASRLYAHELAHALSLRHVNDGKCTLFDSWEKGNLMVQQRHLGIKSEGKCKNEGSSEQGTATHLTPKQLDAVRSFVGGMDVRPSRTLPDGITVGESTMQLGGASPPVAGKLLKHLKKSFSGKGTTVSEPMQCELPQTVLVLPHLACPVANGLVRRVRFSLASPTVSNSYGAKIVILVLTPANPNINLLSGKKTVDVRFKVLQRSAPIELPRRAQNTHIEIDLPEPLPISKDQLVGFVQVSLGPSGKPLRVDSKLYASEHVLYADVVGERTDASGMLKILLPFELRELNSTYPRTAFAPKLRTAFYSAKQTPPSDASEILMSAAPKKSAHWCSALLFNYDVTIV